MSQKLNTAVRPVCVKANPTKDLTKSSDPLLSPQACTQTTSLYCMMIIGPTDPRPLLFLLPLRSLSSSYLWPLYSFRNRLVAGHAPLPGLPHSCSPPSGTFSPLSQTSAWLTPFPTWDFGSNITPSSGLLFSTYLMQTSNYYCTLTKVLPVFIFLFLYST